MWRSRPAIRGACTRLCRQLRENSSVYRSDDAGETWAQITTDPRPVGPHRRRRSCHPESRSKESRHRLLSSAPSPCDRPTAARPGPDFAARPAATTTRTSGSIPTIGNIILHRQRSGRDHHRQRAAHSWSSWYNQPTAQIYHAIADNAFPYRVCGGQQESGSVCISSRGNDGAITFRDWHPVGVIEYGYVAPDPAGPRHHLRRRPDRGFEIPLVDRAGAKRHARSRCATRSTAPTAPSRSCSRRSIRTSFISPANVLFKTTDGGHTWQTISPDLTREHPGSAGQRRHTRPKGARDKQRGVIYALAPSFKNVNTLWAGTDDGLIWITRDGGKNWNEHHAARTHAPGARSRRSAPRTSTSKPPTPP